MPVRKKELKLANKKNRRASKIRKNKVSPKH